MMRVKWAAWIAIYCSCISFANTKFNDDTKQIMSSFMLSISAVVMSYLQNPAPMSLPGTGWINILYTSTYTWLLRKIFLFLLKKIQAAADTWLPNLKICSFRETMTYTFPDDRKKFFCLFLVLLIATRIV